MTMKADYAEILRLAEADELPESAHAGPSTHRVFRLTVGGVDVACKVFRRIHGDELEREWFGLNLLASNGVERAPKPLARSECAVLMSWLRGTVVRGPSTALREALRALYSVELTPPSEVGRANPATTRERTLRRFERIDATKIPRRARDWLESPEAEALCHVHLRHFVRCDGNLDNTSVDERGRVHFVDFEDCGRGNWVFDIADLVEHARSRTVDDREWIEFFRSFDPDEEERARFDDARKLEAIAWLSVFLERDRTAEAIAQADRVSALLT